MKGFLRGKKERGRPATCCREAAPWRDAKAYGLGQTILTRGGKDFKTPPLPRHLPTPGGLPAFAQADQQLLLSSLVDYASKSWATLFAAVSPPGSVFERVLQKFYLGERNGQTLRLLGIAPATAQVA